MFVFKEPFNNLTDNGWSVDAGVTANGQLTGTGATQQYVWKAIPQSVPIGKPFRFDFRFMMTDAAGEDTGYIGLTTDTAGLRPADANKRIAIGLSSIYGLTVYYPTALGGAGDGFATLIPLGSVVKGAYYLASIVSDGKTITFWISNDDGTNIVIKKFSAPNMAINNIYVRFDAASGLTVDRVGMINDLDGYNDSTFNQRLRFYCYPGSTIDENERSIIECPETYIKGSKSKFILLNHGSGGETAETFFQAANYMDLRRNLVTKGYVVGSAQGYGENWGNNNSIKNVRQLRDYIQTNLNVYYKGFILGASMGALPTCLTALEHPDMFAGVILLYPSINLDWRYYGVTGADTGANRSTNINAAYGCDGTNYHRIAKGHNVHDRISDMVRFPIKVWHGDNDTQVGIRHSQDLVNGVNALGGNATLITVAGADHGGAGCFDANGIDTFLQTISNLDRPTYVYNVLQGAIRLS